MSNVPCIIPSLDRPALYGYIFIYNTKITFKAHIHPHIHINTHREIKSSDLDFPPTLRSRHYSLKTHYQLHIHRTEQRCWQNSFEVKTRIWPWVCLSEWRNKGDSCSQEHLPAPVLCPAPAEEQTHQREGEDASGETHSKQKLAGLAPAPGFVEQHRGSPCLQGHCHMGLPIHTLGWKGAELPALLQPDTSSTASHTALLISQKAHLPLHPAAERSATRDWHTKASFLFVICSPDTESGLTAASSILVIETRHGELKVGDRSSATRAAEGKKATTNSHLNHQHWWTSNCS